MDPKLFAVIRGMQNNEATDAHLYTALAQKTKSAHNKKLLELIAADETRHCGIWGKFTKMPPQANTWKVNLFLLLGRIFGLTFTINLMEANEDKTIKAYQELGKNVPVALEILEDETRHEQTLSNMIEEDGLNYIGSMVLGLNDALVELTGTLAGFTLALNDNKTIGLAGFIMGMAATLSMAASEYLAKKADPNEKHPLKAATYTGVSYLITVGFLLTPYILTSNPLFALALCCTGAGLIILFFTFFVSVVQQTSFWKGFREMIAISFGVALISFFIGWQLALGLIFPSDEALWTCGL